MVSDLEPKGYGTKKLKACRVTPARPRSERRP